MSSQKTNVESRANTFLPSGGKQGSGSITNMDQISPELAAQIVKNYILPMFESDGKKQLKSKYNKMAGMASSKFKQPGQGENS